MRRRHQRHLPVLPGAPAFHTASVPFTVERLQIKDCALTSRAFQTVDRRKHSHCSEELCQGAPHAAAPNVLQRVDVGVVQRGYVPPAHRVGSAGGG